MLSEQKACEIVSAALAASGDEVYDGGEGAVDLQLERPPRRLAGAAAHTPLAHLERGVRS